MRYPASYGGLFGLDPPEGLTLEETLDLLESPERLVLLDVMGSGDAPERVPALSESVADKMDRTDETARENLRLRLHHTHLPKLHEADVLEYDHVQQTVSLTERGEALSEQLQERSERETAR